MTEHYPKTFSAEPDSKMIRMEKVTARWPLPHYDILTSQEVPSIVSDGIGAEQLKQGNAIKFDNILYAPAEEQPMELRPLPF
ncbi:MAG: hypothetical protein ACRCXC_10555 [Legionella sp.]